MRKYKLANNDQAKAFVFYQLKEAFRHIDDIIGCIEDVQQVCEDFGLNRSEFLYDWSSFESIYKLKEIGKSYNVWVDVQDTDGLDDLKIGGG